MKLHTRIIGVLDGVILAATVSVTIVLVVALVDPAPDYRAPVAHASS